jgi:AcrR family transcriptional regulator
MSFRVTGQQQRSRDKRALILATARQLFMEQGFDPVSIETIARAAGIGKGTVLAHFSEKATILAIFLAETIDGCISAVRQARQPLFPDRVATTLLPLLEQLLADHAYLRLMISDRPVALAQILPGLDELKFELAKGLAISGLAHPAIAAELVLASIVDVANSAARQRAADPASRFDIGRALLNRLSYILRDPL